MIRTEETSPLELFLTLSPPEEGTESRVCLRRGAEAEAFAEAPSPPFDLAALWKDYLLPLANHAENAFSEERLQNLGRELAFRLLPRPIHLALCALLRRNPLAQISLRLDIQIPELAALPWEFLYLEPDPDVPDVQGFLCKDRRFRLVRQVVPYRPVEPVAFDPLRVLIAWANPASPAYPFLMQPRVEAETVAQTLRRSLPQRLALEIVPNVTPVALEQAIGYFRPHALHFIGHGEGDALILESERRGEETRLSGAELGAWLAGQRARLVVLSACQTASQPNGVAQTLVRCGIPAVVAMQLPLKEDTARRFSSLFYTDLAHPRRLEEAVQWARGQQDVGLDWGIPTLFLAGNGDLFTPGRPRNNLPEERDPHFVGRKALLQEVSARLNTARQRTIVLCGMGGIGKTQIALEYAHSHQWDYPGGVFWFNAHDPERLNQSYAALSRFFDIPESLSLSERADRVSDQLRQASQRALLIFDSVTQETYRLIRPAAETCHRLLTTREYLVRGPVEVAGLSEGEALELLAPGGLPDCAEELAAAREIARMVGYLPLALAVAAQNIQPHEFGFRDYRRRLREDRLQNRSEPRGVSGRTTVNDVIATSFEKLSEPAQRVLAVAACFAERGIPRNLLYEALGRGARADLEDALWELFQASLMRMERDRRLSVHPLVRAFALDRLKEAARQEALGRVAGVLTDHLRQANQAQWWIPFRQELTHCVEAAALCRQYKAWSPLAALLYELGLYRYEHDELSAAARSFRLGLALTERLEGRQSRASAAFLRMLGETRRRQGWDEEALRRARKALRVAKRAFPPDAPELAVYYDAVGLTLTKQGEACTAEARRDRLLQRGLLFHRHALRLCQQAGDQDFTVDCLNNVGAAREDQGALEEALDYLRRALEAALARRAPQRKIAILINNIGRVLRKQGEAGAGTDAAGLLEESLAHHRRALAIYKEIYVDIRALDIAGTLYFLAETLRAMKKPKEASAHYTEALTILRELDIHRSLQETITRRLEQPDSKSLLSQTEES